MPDNVNIYSKVLLALIHRKPFKFVDEEGARTHEKVVLQNPDIKKIMLKLYIKPNFNLFPKTGVISTSIRVRQGW